MPECKIGGYKADGYNDTESGPEHNRAIAAIEAAIGRPLQNRSVQKGTFPFLIVLKRIEGKSGRRR